MKLVKYFIGSLIISFGILLVIGLASAGLQLTLPTGVGDYILFIWIGLALLILPFAKKIVRV